jgi:pimeloyl-ACP methyl ester carboxylesterase
MALSTARWSVRSKPRSVRAAATCLAGAPGGFVVEGIFENGQVGLDRLDDRAGVQRSFHSTSPSQGVPVSASGFEVAGVYLDWLTMRCAAARVQPRITPACGFDGGADSFGFQQVFESAQPVVVIGVAEVGVAFGMRGCDASCQRPMVIYAAAASHDIWMATSRGHVNLHETIAYIPDRRAHERRWVDALESTDVPLNFIWGMLDPVSRAHMTARVHERIPAATVTQLDNVGHWPAIEAPDAVLTAISP